MKKFVIMLVFVLFIGVVFSDVTTYAGTKSDTESKTTEAKKKKAKKEYEKSGITIKVKDSNKELMSYKGEIQKSSGRAKFKTSKGKVLKSKFFVYKGSVYYAAKDGYLADGWEKIRGNYYFFGREDHKMKKGCSHEKVTITSYGVADSSSLKRAKCYAKVDNLVESKTNRTDSKATKLKKSFKYIMSLGYHRYRQYRNMRNKTDWDVTFANDIINHKQGCCVSESAAFGFMAVACGYTSVTVCCDTSHAWVDIGGKLFDPLFAESRSFSANYNANYTDYRRNAAIKARIN